MAPDGVEAAAPRAGWVAVAAVRDPAAARKWRRFMGEVAGSGERVARGKAG